MEERNCKIMDGGTWLEKSRTKREKYSTLEQYADKKDVKIIYKQKEK